MIIRYNTGANVSGAIRYNEEKVLYGEGTLLKAQNFPSERLALQYQPYRDGILNTYADKNLKIEKPSVHFVLAYSPDDTINSEKMIQLADEFMRKMGFGTQPYLLYRHDDTSHPHCHIVTVRIDENGKAIADNNIKLRCNEARKELEISYNLVKAEDQKKVLTISSTLPENAIHYGEKETKKAIGNVVQTAMKDYSFSSLIEFEKFLGSYNIQMNLLKAKEGQSWKGITFQLTDGNKTLSPAIKASSYSFAPTVQNLVKRFRNGTQKKAYHKAALVQKINQVLTGGEIFSETDFKTALRTASIQVVDDGKNYFYVDHTKRMVYSELELGNKLTRAYLKDQFVKPVSQNRSRKQNAANEQNAASAQIKSAIDGLKSILNPAQQVELQKQVSRHYQAYKKEKAIFFESQLLDQFPFKELVERLQSTGLSTTVASQAVASFEQYKQKLRPEIEAKEVAYFDRTTRAYLNLATQMPISFTSKRHFLSQLNLDLIQSESGEPALVHQHHKQLEFIVPNGAFQQLFQGDDRKIPFTRSFTKDEKALFLAAGNGQSLQGVSHYTIQFQQLKSMLPTQLFDQISQDLNRNTLQLLLTCKPTKEPLTEDYFYQRGVLLKVVDNTLKAGFYNTSVSSYMPLSEFNLPDSFISQLKAHGPEQEQQLASSLGLSMIKYSQAYDLQISKMLEFVKEQSLKKAPSLNGLTGEAFQRGLLQQVKAQKPGPISASIRQETQPLNPVHKEILQKEYWKYILEKGYYYESTLLKRPHEFPTGRLINALTQSPLALSRQEAEQVENQFRSNRFSQFDRIEASNLNSFEKMSQGYLSMTLQAPLTVADRKKMLNAFYLQLNESPQGDLILTHRSDPRFRRVLTPDQVATLFTVPANPSKVPLPGNEFPRQERKFYELVLKATQGVPADLNFFSLHGERVKTILTDRQWAHHCPMLNRNTLQQALKKAPIDEREKLNWLFQRGMLIQPTSQGYRLGFHLSAPDTFAPSPQSLDSLLRRVTPAVFAYQQQALATERGRAMVELASAIDGQNAKRVDYLVKKIVARANDLKPFSGDSQRLLEALSKTTGPLALDKPFNPQVRMESIDTNPFQIDNNVDNVGGGLRSMDVTDNEVKKKKNTNSPARRRPRLRR